MTLRDSSTSPAVSLCWGSNTSSFRIRHTVFSDTRLSLWLGTHVRHFNLPNVTVSHKSTKLVSKQPCVLLINCDCDQSSYVSINLNAKLKLTLGWCTQLPWSYGRALEVCCHKMETGHTAWWIGPRQEPTCHWVYHGMVDLQTDRRSESGTAHLFVIAKCLVTRKKQKSHRDYNQHLFSATTVFVLWLTGDQPLKKFNWCVLMINKMSKEKNWLQIFFFSHFHQNLQQKAVYANERVTLIINPQ